MNKLLLSLLIASSLSFVGCQKKEPTKEEIAEQEWEAAQNSLPSCKEVNENPEKYPDLWCNDRGEVNLTFEAQQAFLEEGVKRDNEAALAKVGMKPTMLPYVSEEFLINPEKYMARIQEEKENADMASNNVQVWVAETPKGSLQPGELMCTECEKYNRELRKVQQEAALVKQNYYNLQAGIWNDKMLDEVESVLLSVGQLDKGVYPKQMMGNVGDGREQYLLIQLSNDKVCHYKLDTKRHDLLGRYCTKGRYQDGGLWDVQVDFEGATSKIQQS